MSLDGKKYAYIERVVLEDYGIGLPELVAAIVLAHGNCPPAKERPYENFKRWKQGAATILCDIVPEATRTKTFPYVPILVNYISRAYLGRKRIDNYYHDQAIYQIKAARKKARDAAQKEALTKMCA